jgi:hypothetical protein
MVKEKIREDERRIVGKDRVKKKIGEKEKPKKDVFKKRDEIKFVAKEKAAPLRVTKVKFKTQKDIEEELENLAKDFTKSKD